MTELNSLYALYRYGTETPNFVFTCLLTGFEFCLRHKNRESFVMMRCAHGLISSTSNFIYLFLLLVAVSYYKCIIFCILPLVRYENNLWLERSPMFLKMLDS